MKSLTESLQASLNEASADLFRRAANASRERGGKLDLRRAKKFDDYANEIEAREAAQANPHNLKPGECWIDYTECAPLRAYTKRVLKFNEINDIISWANEQLGPLHIGYDKTDFEICYEKDGIYAGTYDVGADSYDLVTHIKDHCEYILKNGARFYDYGEDILDEYRELLNDVVPKIRKFAKSSSFKHLEKFNSSPEWQEYYEREVEYANKNKDNW